MRPEDVNINKLEGTRITAGRDIDNRLHAHSVSPHSKDFLSTLEPEIRDIILTLRSKLYWTLSSCQGHHLKDSRNFTVAFRTNKDAHNFCNLINFHVKGLTTSIHHPEEYMDYEIKQKGKNIKLEKNTNNTREMAVHSLNKLFRTYYKSFFIVEVRITDYIFTQDSFFTKIKKYVDRILFKDRRTKALLRYLSEEIEYYWV